MSKGHTTGFGGFAPRGGGRTSQEQADVQFFIDGFLFHQRALRHSPNTLKYYQWDLKRFVWFLDHFGYPQRLDELTPNHIRHFFVYLSEQATNRWGSVAPSANRPLSPGGIHGFARALRAFLNWACTEADIPNPFERVEMPKVPNAWQVEAFTDEEIVTLFETVGKTGRPFTVARNRAILALLLDTGLRASELLSLDLADVTAEGMSFKVKGKRERERYVVVGSFAKRELWNYTVRFRRPKEAGNTALYVSEDGRPLTYDGLKDIFRRLKIASGITRVAVKCHNCRHTAATKMHRNGMSLAVVQELLGHSNFDTTRRFYLNVAPEDLVAEHRQFGTLDNLSTGLSPWRRASSTASLGVQGRHPLPSPKALKVEVEKAGYRATARKYGVSDTTVRNHLRRAGLI